MQRGVGLAVPRSDAARCAARFVLRICLGMGASTSLLAAEPRVNASILGGVTLPDTATSWRDDPDGSKGAEMDLAALLVARNCVSREFLVWSAADTKAANAVRDRTDAAFTRAGWAFTVVSRSEEGRRLYLASRGGRELIVNWVPIDQQMGLLLCTTDRKPASPAADTAVAKAGPIPVPNAIRSAADAEKTGRARSEPVASDLPLVVAALPEKNPPTTDSGGSAGAASAPAATLPGRPVPDSFAAAWPAEAASVVAPPPPRDPAPAAIPAPSRPDSAVASDRTRDTSGKADAGPLRKLSSVLAGLSGRTAGELHLRLINAEVASLILAGLALLGFGARRRARDDVGSWPTTVATILDSYVAEEHGVDDSGAEVTWYEPVVSYHYEYDGEDRFGSRIRMGDTRVWSWAEAERVIACYPAHAGVDLAFDPDDPDFTVLEEERRSANPGLVLGLLCIGGAAMGAILSAL